MTPMFADLLRAQWRLRRHVRSLIGFLVGRPRDGPASRGRSGYKPGSLRAETSSARSDPADPPHPEHPTSFRLRGRPARVWHLRRRGCSDASGSGWSAGSLPDRP